MSNSVNRQVHRKQSDRDKARREISRLPLFEKPEDPAKEARNIRMAYFPPKKQKKD